MPDKFDEDDYWTDLSGARSGVGTGLVVDAGQIHLAELTGLTPQPRGFGTGGTWIPEGMRDALFGAPETFGATYLLLDAAAVPFLTDLLEASGTRFTCLFQGDAAETYSDTAPWLVPVAEDSPILRYCFTEGDAQSWHLWSRPTGVFVRSPAGLEAVRSALRRFTRVRTEAEAWLFLRLADPATLARYLAGKGAPGTSRAQVFAEGTITRVICRSGSVAQVFTWDGAPPAKAPVTLLDEEVLDFRLMIYERRAVEIEARLRRTFPDHLAARPAEDVRTILASALLRLSCYGFDRAGDMEIMASWDVLFGAPFESLDPTGGIARVCTSDASPMDRFSAILERMDALGAANG